MRRELEGLKSSPIIWVTDPLRLHHYEQVLNQPELKDARILIGAYEESIRPDLSLISCEFNSHSFVDMARLQRVSHVPALHVVDGVCEWRNVWENPRSMTSDCGMPLFQPLCADKVACIGPAQARLFESWGAHGRCEVTGLPRVDPLIDRSPFRDQPVRARGRTGGGKHKIVIASARTPAFDASQRDAVVRGFADLNEVLRASAAVQPLEVWWRITDKSYLPRDKIGESSSMSMGSLVDAIRDADALISTPSTVILEGMLLGIPTCMLDYTNSPRFLSTAWSISAREHVAREVKSLLTAEERRLQYQHFLLHDQMRCDTPAAPRVANLILEMVDISRSARQQGVQPEFPASMVPGVSAGQAGFAYRPELLFPAHEVFSRRDHDCVLAENGHLHLLIKSMRREAARPIWERGWRWFRRRLGGLFDSPAR